MFSMQMNALNIESKLLVRSAWTQHHTTKKQPPEDYPQGVVLFQLIMLRLLHPAQQEPQSLPTNAHRTPLWLNRLYVSQ